jgi:hypothetical protein
MSGWGAGDRGKGAGAREEEGFPRRGNSSHGYNMTPDESGCISASRRYPFHGVQVCSRVIYHRAIFHPYRSSAFHSIVHLKF